MHYGLCFDGSRILGVGPDGRTLDFDNTLASGHYDRVAEDYALARSMGITRFRDSVLWQKTSPTRRGLDTAWLNQLADLSEGQIELAMLHYLGPEWLTEAEFWSGKAAEHLYHQARYIAHAYKGCFRSYNACVELGTWTNLIAAPHDRQWPRGNKSWWEVYRVTSKIALSIAKGLKHGDPDCQVSMCEPWGMPDMAYDDQARPFNTLLGYPDEVAERENCHTWQEGEPGLLDIVGLNMYVPAPMGPPLAEARRRFSDLRVIVGETANTQTSHDSAQWNPATWWERFEVLQQPDIQVNWCPGLECLTHETGEFYGAHLINRYRQPQWSASGLIF